MAAVAERATPVVEAATALRDAAFELEDAAWREGIEPDGLLGPFVRAMKEALVRLGELSALTETAMGSNIDAIRKLSEAESQKLKQMVEAAGAAVRQARQAQVNLELERELVAARLVEHLGPQIAEGIKHWRVIKETEFNRRSARRRATITTAVALLLVLGAYFGRAWEDREATSAFAHCIAHRVIDQNNAREYCAVSDLAPQ
jgi:hypothetical protein